MLRYMTAGESHGKGMMAILDGMPSGLEIKEEFINSELSRRMIGYGRGGRMKIEKDTVDIISGLYKGKTIGSPIGLLVHNKDFKINTLPSVKCPRPGHADLVGMQKYDLDDARGVLERASARDTVSRVAVGAILKIFLNEFGIKIISHVTMLGGIKADVSSKSFDKIREEAEASDLRCADSKAARLMREKIDEVKAAGDTLGGTIEVIAIGLPTGLGSYAQWDRKLDGLVSRAILSIQAVKAVSIGDGVECAEKKGSEVHDPIGYDKKEKTFKRASNNAGGTEGGVTNSAPLIVKVFMKPISTLMDPLKSVNIDDKSESGASVERSDVTAVPSCGVVAEAVVAFELGKAFLEKFGGDSMSEIRRNYEGYMAHLREM